jgi:glucose/arabinose dehydrogenase/mono/diheme cytochrome c family protein
MKKILLAIVVLILVIPLYLLASGKIGLSSVSMILNVMTGSGIDSPNEQTVKGRFTLPPGFSISLYAGDVPNARFITMTDNRDLLITRPHRGEVLLISADKSQLGRSGERTTLLVNLNRPSGLAVHKGWLYIGESDAIGRVRFNQASGKLQGDYERIITGLTDDGNHPYKNIGIGPDEKLYVAQGSTCNVCLEADTRRGAMSRFNLDGTGEESVATGLRNSMDFEWTPWDGELFATDNGRDMLGDDYPPCEFNHIKLGQFYGWPFFNGNNRVDPDFSEAPAELASNPIAPAHEFSAHNAPLGMGFINGSKLPDEFNQSALVALHGSWNRSSPDGYKVVSLHWKDGKITRKDFLTGFEKDSDIIGRPVDITQDSDGAIYISDDYAGAIYRVAYGEPQLEFQAPLNKEESAELPKKESNLTPFVLAQPEWLTADNKSDHIAKGKKLYNSLGCHGCHQNAADASRLNLMNVNLRLQYNDVINKLSKPTPPMPTFPLSQADKQALASFLMDRAAN